MASFMSGGGGGFGSGGMMMGTTTTTTTSASVGVGVGVGGGNGTPLVIGGITESQHRIDMLSNALNQMSKSTHKAGICCDHLSSRTTHLDSLTSPASDASALLTQASENLSSTLSLLKDAREKFDTVSDCEPAILRLRHGAQEAIESMKTGGSGGKGGGGAGKSAFMPDKTKKSTTATTAGSGGGVTGPDGGLTMLSEQDVYAAADSMEILRDAYDFFLQRMTWKSTPPTLSNLERVHQSGVDAMCLLITVHLTAAGPAVRIKRDGVGGGGSGGGGRSGGNKLEQAHETRKRLTDALQNRDLMKAVGEYEDVLPLDTRPIRELRAIMECLSGDGCYLGNIKSRPSVPPPPKIDGNKMVRTEKVGSGYYSNLTKNALKTGFQQLDAYGEARKAIAFASIDGYYRHLKNEHKKRLLSRRGSMSATTKDGSEVDAAARDAVRCLEHAMVVVAGEKGVFRCVISHSSTTGSGSGGPSSSSSSGAGAGNGGGGNSEDGVSREAQYKSCTLRAYSHVVSSVVDRTMDVIELVFFKDLGIGQASSPGAADSASNPRNSVRAAASAAAAGLRILDGVRILGPSLAKLCDLSESKQQPSLAAAAAGKDEEGNGGSSMAGSLCISIHRTTVKNCARTLENLVKAIQNNPLDGEGARPPDCRVAPISSDVVRAVRLISPFVSAYKSVTKRRSLQWDPKIGEEAGDMDMFVRHLISQLLSNLQGKAGKYMDEQDQASTAKAPLFMINNTYYLTEQLCNSRNAPPSQQQGQSADEYSVDKTPWFKQKVGALFQAQKEIYLAHWEILNKHLTAVHTDELTYQKNGILSLESGRLIKSRFSGFTEEFETIYTLHKPLTVIDRKLRELVQEDVRRVFLPRYTGFFDQYSKIQFSKKNQLEYLKYPPQKVDAMINELYETL